MADSTSKFGHNDRLGSGPIPDPLQSETGDDEFYVMKANRTDAEFAYEQQFSGLHQAPPS